VLPHMAHMTVKRDLVPCQKSPTSLSKETYARGDEECHYRVKRDLLQCQKRPITVSKETYVRGDEGFEFAPSNGEHLAQTFVPWYVTLPHYY